MLAYFFYVVVYGYAKRHTIHSTLIGTIPGAIPPVAGYVAVSGSLDALSALLFLIMVCWQMAHFYSIGMRRRDDYEAAELPVMPVIKGMHATKIQVMYYVTGFVVLNALIVLLGYMGVTYLVVMTGLGAIWLVKGIRGFETDNDQKWAKRMFLFSLVVLLAFCGMIAVGALLP
jgi:protoheme IX farnesyltransferase